MANNIWIGAVSNDYAVAGNWIGGVPIASHNVFLTAGAANAIDASLDQSAVAITSFTQDMGFTQTVGDFTAGVRNSLKLNCPLATLGAPLVTGNPGGSGKVYLDFGSVATACTVLNTGQSALDTGQTPVHLLGTSLTLGVWAGVVGVALNIGEVSTLTALTVDGGNVALGAGVTPTAIKIFSGLVVSQSNITAPAVTVYSKGVYSFNGSATHSSVIIEPGAVVNFNGTGTITLLDLNGTIDLSNGTGTVTITNMNRGPKGKFKDPNGRAVFTNPWQDIGGAALGDNGSDFGPNRTYSVA